MGAALVIPTSSARTTSLLRKPINTFESVVPRNETRGLADNIFDGTSKCGRWERIGDPIGGSSEFEYSGSSLATSGDGRTIAIGAPYNSDTDTHMGTVRVFQLNNGWQQIGGDITGQQKNDLFGSSIAMSSNGRIVAIGSKGHDGDMKDTGRVKVIRYISSTDTWEKFGNVIVGDKKREWLGSSIAMASNGRTMAVSSSGANWKTATTVYAYNTENDRWKQVGESFVEKSTGDVIGGVTVSMSDDGSILAIGCRQNSEMGDSAGYARLYQYDSVGMAWEQLGQTLYGLEAGENFGAAIASTGDGLAVAIGADGCKSNTGCVRVYDYRENLLAWKQRGPDIVGEAKGSLAGTSVSISSLGDIIAVGAIGGNSFGDDSGHTNLYTFGQGRDMWFKVGNSIFGDAKDDFSGGQVTLSDDGTTVLVAAPLNSLNGKYR